MIDLRIVQYSSIELITLEQARLHLRIYETDAGTHPDDSLIEALISASRQYAEQFLGRTLTQTIYEYRIDAFTTEIELPVPPVVLIDGITYLDDDGVRQTVDPLIYELDENPDSPVIKLLADEEWPSGTLVRIQFTAGYVLTEESPLLPILPFTIRAAMLLVIGHLYDNREASTEANLKTLPLGVESLLRPYRVRLGMA
jgi:uncharacterized phiE125 gp8 family phage protein